SCSRRTYVVMAERSAGTAMRMSSARRSVSSLKPASSPSIERLERLAVGLADDVAADLHRGREHAVVGRERLLGEDEAAHTLHLREPEIDALDRLADVVVE